MAIAIDRYGGAWTINLLIIITAGLQLPYKFEHLSDAGKFL